MISFDTQSHAATGDKGSLTAYCDEPMTTYTRAQSLEDGLLVSACGQPGLLTMSDFTKVSARHFPGVDVAMTREVFELIQKSAMNPDYNNDYASVWHDILWMFKLNAGIGRDIVYFRVIITGTGRAGDTRPVSPQHILKGLLHRGDRGEKCLTIMLPYQD